MVTEAPVQTVPERHPIEFTASGSEYFRIWIVNLLLIVVSLGIYLPWAKVRKLKYFYSNTWVGGDALDFHGEPAKMLRGTLIAAGFLIAYSVGSNFSGWAAVVAALAFVALWPALFRASMRFRLANTSWRGLRFRFTGDMAGAYACMLPPLALALLPVALAGAMAGVSANGKPPALAAVATGVVGLGMLAFGAGLPYFLWRVRRYQHDHYAIGALQTRLKADVGVLYGIFIKLIAISLAALALMLLVAGVFAFSGRRTGIGATFVVVAAFMGFGAILLVNILPKSYLQVRLQNLLWSTTGNEVLRFDSRLKFGTYLRLQCRNYLLILLTLGLYWPFAVVNTRRAQLEAVELQTRIGLDQLSQTARREDPGAAGDMAADLFGLDIGL
ncbi:Inner membrane protein YjgN [Variovorax sp. PBS-H4]|uniref:YjgN family protein n=1 Tax=Variovorax sp. PBS-H4 TaxID=434008 RepID=UPI001318FB78|nr:YjgN family protein [Variovorax sp. PBS-H4]VTU41104.1 Inner membrane protein YjgN [Variovorax sp. PBS-H4]